MGIRNSLNVFDGSLSTKSQAIVTDDIREITLWKLFMKTDYDYVHDFYSF